MTDQTAPERTYTEAELQAAVAAALERAADEAGSLRFREDQPYDGRSLAAAHEAIRALITPEQSAALDRVKAEARKEERRAIFDRITDYIEGAPCDGINAEGEFSEAVWLSQRKFIDGMRQARAAASSRAAAVRAEAEREKG